MIIGSLALSPLFIYFFVWPKILLYRVLDPLKKVGSELFLPKMLVSALIAILGVFLFLKQKVETIESSFISAVVIQDSFERFNMKGRLFGSKTNQMLDIHRLCKKDFNFHEQVHCYMYYARYSRSG